MIEYNFVDSLDCCQFGKFLILFQEYELLDLETEKAKDIYNVAIEYIETENFSNTLDIYENFDYNECKKYYTNLVKSITITQGE